MQRGIFMSDTVNEAIKRAICIAGSQSELARKTGVNQSTVSKWLNGAEIGSRFIKSIVIATDGQVSASEILNSISHRYRQRKYHRWRMQ